MDKQTAIDLLDNLLGMVDDNHESDYDTAIKMGIDAIKALPSVQSGIIRCKDCEWFRKEYGWNCIEYTVCGVSPTHHPIRREEDFCSYAERKSDG